MKIRFVFAAIIAVLMTVATATEATAQYGRHGYYRGRGAYYFLSRLPAKKAAEGERWNLRHHHPCIMHLPLHTARRHQ